MPTYVYGCDTCGHRFEQFQKFQDAPLTECPNCGARIRRILQPAGIVFKGSGWYSKDSRAGSQSSEKSESSADTKKTSSDSATKSEQSSASSSDSDAKTTTKSDAAAPSKAAD